MSPNDKSRGGGHTILIGCPGQTTSDSLGWRSIPTSERAVRMCAADHMPPYQPVRSSPLSCFLSTPGSGWGGGESRDGAMVPHNTPSPAPVAGVGRGGRLRRRQPLWVQPALRGAVPPAGPNGQAAPVGTRPGHPLSPSTGCWKGWQRPGTG